MKLADQGVDYKCIIIYTTEFVLNLASFSSRWLRRE